jgi:uncharacterized membrane protein
VTELPRAHAPEPWWSDRRLDDAVSLVLRAGVVLAALLVGAGGVLFLVRHGGEPPGYATFRGEPEELRHFGGAVRAAVSGSGRALIQVGLFALVATPVARVALTLVAFALQRDRLYVAITTLVLALLLLGMIGVLR